MPPRMNGEAVSQAKKLAEQAAKILGITRGSLRSKLRMLGITINQAVHLDDSDDETSSPASSSSLGG